MRRLATTAYAVDYESIAAAALLMRWETAPLLFRQSVHENSSGEEARLAEERNRAGDHESEGIRSNGVPHSGHRGFGRPLRL